MLYNKGFKVVMLLGISSLLIGIGCASDNEAVEMNGKSFDNQKSLASQEDIILNDPIFQGLVENDYYYYKNADKQKIADYSADGTIDDAEGKLMANALGFSSDEDFRNWEIAQADRLTYMENTYSFSKFTDDERTGLYLGHLNNSGLSPLVPVIIQPQDPGYETYLSCDAKFNWCTAGAITAGGAAHAACLWGDAATGGLSAWFCHSLAISLQTTMYAGCQGDYDTCMGRD